MNNIDILEEELRKDILYQIDMQLYDEFNDKFCEIEENLGTIYSYKDLEDLKKAESDTERTLLREAVSTLIAENKELKEKKEKIINKLKEDVELASTTAKWLDKRTKQVVPTKTIIVNESDYAKTILKILEG